jgi:putative FmdB family regulatory protein
MAPLREYLCLDCAFQFEELVNRENPEPEDCPHCESHKIERLLSAPGGYAIYGNNSASVRPKSAGSFKKAAK